MQVSGFSAGLFLPQITGIFQCWAGSCSLESFWGKDARAAGTSSVLCSGGQKSCIPLWLGKSTTLWGLAKIPSESQEGISV